MMLHQVGNDGIGVPHQVSPRSNARFIPEGLAVSIFHSRSKVMGLLSAWKYSCCCCCCCFASEKEKNTKQDYYIVEKGNKRRMIMKSSDWGKVPA